MFLTVPIIAVESYTFVLPNSELYCFSFLLKVRKVKLCIENCGNGSNECETLTFELMIKGTSQFYNSCYANWNVTYLTGDNFLVQMRRNTSNVTESWECANGASSAFSNDYPDRPWYDTWSFSYERDGRWYSGFVSEVSAENRGVLNNEYYYLRCRTKKNGKACLLGELSFVYFRFLNNILFLLCCFIRLI